MNQDNNEGQNQNESGAAPMSSADASQSASAQTSEGNTKLMAILAYIGPLVIISYLVAKDDPFVKFHIKQGLVLFVIEVALWVFSSMLFVIWPLVQIIHLAILILAIIGIVNAAKEQEKELPLVGKFASHFNI